VNSTKKPFKLNLILSDFKASGMETLTIFTVIQYDTCEEDGKYMLVTEDHDPIWDEIKHFKRGDSFPDDRGWIWFGD